MKLGRHKDRGGKPAIALALGGFDGMHLGHQAMLRRVVEAANELNLVPTAMTFDPMPRDFFSPTEIPERIISLDSRLEQMAEIGIAQVYVLRFDADIAKMDAETFVGDFLEKQLNVRWFLATHDTRFGKDRRGDLDFLRARSNNFTLETIEVIENDGEKISSTAVRQSLVASDFAHAAQLLGRPYAIAGRVANGDARGRAIGFPTVNLPLDFKPPISGVFAVRVHGLGTVREGVANLGVRPTVNPLIKETLPILETHIFDFDEDVYGQHIEVEFVKKLRDEMRFPDVESLKKQIKEDAHQAREFFLL
ncbi:bifunctional riboflavin kinase/FAD synthetase [Candidatus Saccharibacteria bacterium]|nr:bifunctional riboflavin kinase/FAD synthetase [Candidatus Saccharibacteria bacterium]